MVDRSIEMVLGIMAILKAGSAYMPIDPGYPKERINYMLQDSNAEISLTTRSLSEKIALKKEIVYLESNIKSAVSSESSYQASLDRYPAGGAMRHVSLASTSLAYVIYTSGTTGNPKAVMIEHKSVINLVMGLKEVVYNCITNTTSPVNVSLLSPYVFDASVKQIFASLLLGHRLIIVPEEARLGGENLLRYYKEKEIYVSDGTPMHLSMMLYYKTALANDFPVRIFLIGGDQLDLEISKQLIETVNLKRKGESIKLINVYGPTECCDVTTSYKVIEEAIKGFPRIPRIPIGKPLSNVRAHILGNYMEPQVVGVQGELYIGGEGLGRGFLNQVEETSEKFIIDPFAAGEQLYRTGDLVEWLPDGNIEFLGRIDQQVKIRGFRIELGEIEKRLLSHSKVKETVVIARHDSPGDKYLCAYIVTSTDIDVEELRKYLSQSLPDYMIPSFFIQIEEIPLTPNGKINRKALPAPEFEPGERYIAPRNEIEVILVDIWSEILGTPVTPVGNLLIGIDDNFFELGGHSLKATILVSKIHKELNVKLPLAEIFKTPTIRGLTEYIKDTGEERYASIEPAEGKEYYALSSAQKRLYILHQLDLEGTAYNMPKTIPLEEEPDLVKFEETFIKLINRHESLRTSFHMIGDEPVQRINNKLEFKIDNYDLTAKTREDTRRENEIHHSSFIIHHFVRPFNLSQPPLMRVGLIKTGDAKYLLMIDMHHIISDGVSQQILIQDFMALYNEELLLPLRIQYKDFSEWQNKEKEKENVCRQEAYWLKQFAEDAPILNLPADFMRQSGPSFKGTALDFEMGPEETNALKQLAMHDGVTLYMVLLTFFYILLYKLSGQEDIVIGTPVLGRRHADLQGIIGMFVNTLALRNYPVGEKGFKEFLTEVKERSLEAFENQEYPFEELVEKIEIDRDVSRNPLFNVMFSLRDVKVDIEENLERKKDADAANRHSSKYERNISKFDLSLDVAVGEKLLFIVQYSTKLFKQATIERFIRYFKEISDSLINNGEKKISEIDILTVEEKRQLLIEFNDTDMDIPDPLDITVQELFEKQVERAGDKIAIISMEHGEWSMERRAGIGAMSMTYRELNEKSNQLAFLLRKTGIRPGSIVSLMLKRSVEMIIGVLGVLKAGGAYLPIDPGYPEDRIEYILNESRSELVLVDGDILKDVKFPGKTISLDVLADFKGNRSNPKKINAREDLAYVIYTSGSTGNPKGVLVEHKNVTNYVLAFLQEFELTSEDTILQQASYTFDAFVEEVYPILLTGGKIVIPGKFEIMDMNILTEFIVKYHVNIVDCSPLVLNELNKRFPIASDIKLFISGGDTLKAEYVENLCKYGSVYNTYGPTETTVCATFYRYRGFESEKLNIPIGRPIANYKSYVVDRDNRLVPLGVPGELCISGGGVTRGYLNNPALTAEKFDQDLQDYQDEKEKEKGTVKLKNMSYMSYLPYLKLYHTGDLARWLPDGNIEFLGRLDQQVKIRGFRIELGEIEYQLLKHPEVKETVVLTQTDESDDKYLCAYIVPNVPGDVDVPSFDSNKTSSISAKLGEYLSQSLPAYMIPTYFVELEKIPLTPNGKIDRNALPLPAVKGEGEYTVPSNEIEEKLAEIWSGVLGIEKDTISINDNFFKIGGHSLKATILASKIRDALNVNIPLVQIFQTPTIKSLWEYIRRAEIGDFLKDDNNLVLLKPGYTSANHLFLVHDGTGEVEGYIQFCNLLSETFNYWGIRADRLENLTPQNWTIKDLAQKYIEKIKKVQPPGSGPYFIAGWSIGGSIAFEMARQLEKEKEQVAFLGLIDTKSPSIWRWLGGKVFLGTFSRRSELKCINEVLIMEFEIEERARKIKNMEHFWPEIVNYLETGGFDKQSIKRRIMRFGRQVLPNFQRLSVRDCIYYLNMGRTLTHAVENYIPLGKINAPVHYFRASQSWQLKVKHWKKYTRAPIQFYAISGDHLSIFKSLYVSDFAKTFDQAVNKMGNPIPPESNVSNK